MALDYFDASINRISAWVVGFRSWQKALLWALCTPHVQLKNLQEEADWTTLMVRQEKMKTMPFGDIWEEYCERCQTPEDQWYDEVRRYEAEALSQRK
jgi:L-rhamnose isomerase